MSRLCSSSPCCVGCCALVCFVLLCCGVRGVVCGVVVAPGFWLQLLAALAAPLFAPLSGCSWEFCAARSRSSRSAAFLAAAAQQGIGCSDGLLALPLPFCAASWLQFGILRRFLAAIWTSHALARASGVSFGCRRAFLRLRPRLPRFVRLLAASFGCVRRAFSLPASFR